MVSIQKHRGGLRAEMVLRGRLRKIWLGKCTKTQAKAIAKHLDALRIAAELGLEPPRETILWLTNIGPRIKEKLLEFGLLGSSRHASTLQAFIDEYIASRNDWKSGTLSRWNNVKQHVVTFFGAETALATITAADAERFARWARSNFKALSHSGKVISDVRQIFEVARKSRVIHENPFVGIDASQPHNKDREFYVTEAVADELIENAGPMIAAVIASARYGGLRIPSECLALKWTDINWDQGRVRVTDSKRKTERIVPLFPKWQKALDELWDLSDEGAVHVFEQYRTSANKMFRQHVLAVLEHQKIKAWPKLFQNMRASRETDLKKMFPGEEHVVCYWIGNSEKVAAKHYDRIHDDHYSRGLG